ncbi:MAG: glycoside hydrolase family 92 protein [Bacteroidota bacterium]|nr:glycoside hydrolase family 92 protein [Bacteroidota bacterium]
MQKNISIFTGKSQSGVALNFSTNGNEQVIIRTGISMVNIEGAKHNLETEMQPYGFDFDKLVKVNKDAWNKLLSKAEVFTKNENDKEKFYTNLYRTYTGKSVMNDVDGKYTDACGIIQQLQGSGRSVYSSDAWWGTQWNLTPLWTLLNPGIAESWVNAFLELADKGGWIPYAPVALGYSPIMGAQHQNTLIISSYQKGIRGFDVQKAFKDMLHDYTTPGEAYKCGGFAGDRHLASYEKLGYVADEAGPASNTMEYAYDDWCFAQFAKALGKKETYGRFMLRSKNYKNQFDTTVNYVRRRGTDGSFVEPFDPNHFGTEGGWNGKGFMEGSPYQYSFFVPQDVPGIIRLMGKDTFINRLENGFKNNLFDMGNQPSLAIPFLFNYAGKPWLTQHYTRLMANTMFDTSPYSGWVGEEDEGQMSATFVLLSMGLFEVDGGCAVRPFYNLSTPLFDKIILHLDDKYYPGKTFTILTKNNSIKNEYIQAATLNGKSISRAWIYHDEIIGGGTLIFTLGAKPNPDWGTQLPPADDLK